MYKKLDCFIRVCIYIYLYRKAECTIRIYYWPVITAKPNIGMGTLQLEKYNWAISGNQNEVLNSSDIVGKFTLT